MMSNNKRAWSDAPGHVVVLISDVEVGMSVDTAQEYAQGLIDAISEAISNDPSRRNCSKCREEKPSKWLAFWAGFRSIISCISFDICYFAFMTILAFFMSYAENYAGAITLTLSMISYFVFMIHLNVEEKK